MSRALLRLLGPLAAAFLLSTTLAQPTSEEGRPLLRRFSPKDYLSHYQVWCATQASDGRMWFGSLNGAVIFDGHAWTKAAVPTSFVRHITEGPRGRMFVGGEDVLGYIEADGFGGWRYVSLVEKLPAESRALGLARRVARVGDDIFVATDRSVVRLRGDEVRTWPFDPARRGVVDVVGDQIYLLREADGIFRLRGDTFEPWAKPAGMERRQFTFLLPADGATALLVLGNDGIFRLDADGRPTPWGQPARALAGSAAFFSGRRLRDGSYAFGTVNAGVILLSADGATARQVAVADGLTSDIVTGLGEDREGGLWAATQNGITRLDRTTPASVFDDTNGLGEGLTHAIIRHAGTLYTVFGNRLLRLAPSAQPGRARWEAEPAVSEKTKINAIASHARGLVVGSNRGVQLLADGRLAPLVDSPVAITTLAVSASDPGRVFLGWGNTVSSVRFTDGRWRDEGAIKGVEGAPFSMLEESDGTLWVATDTRGVFRLRRASGTDTWSEPAVKNYHERDGSLPAGHGWVFVSPTPFGPRFSSEKGVFKHDPATGRLVPDEALAAAGGRLPLFEAFVGSAADEAWAMNASNRLQPERPLVRIRARSDGRYSVTDAPSAIGALLGLSGLQLGRHEAGPGGGVLWARGLDKLVRIDLTRLAETDRSAAPLLTGFSAEGRTQSLPSPTADTVAAPTTVRYSTEPLVLRFASVRFGEARPPRFQTRLVGFRDEWSAPQPGTEAVFTNLEGGPFRFEVRTVDGDGRTGPAATLAFSVTPPWQRTGWAFAAYALAALGAVAGFVRWRLGHAERERARLEQLVARRTTELAAAKEQADAARRQADDANQAKSAFLASMSHELRTPLNGVIGYAQVLMKDRELSEKNRERLRIVQTSGEHLLRMINEVLDFSKIEAGRMELHPAPFHLPQLLRDIAAAISTRAEQKGLEFVFAPAADLPEMVVGDAQKLRQVIDNLLGNAIKFTARGEVRFTAHAAGPELVAFAVADTGPGIGAADQTLIFQPFQQATESRPPEPGTGLGLTISQRFVTLMGGRLALDSRPGAGSRFSFELRLPALAVDTTDATGTPRVVTGYAGPRRTVLIVDDVAVNRHVLRDLLQPLGFEILEAAGGEAALAMELPELVFVDLRMPGMGGLELARRIRARPDGGRFKLIAMSASVLQFKKSDALAAGCDDFLPKPFRETELLAKLAAALDLQWTFAEPAAPRRDSRQPFPATATRLAPAAVEELLGCARRGEIVALRDRLAALRAQRDEPDSLLDALDTLARSYRMEQIRALLERHAAARPAPPA